jgi:hypothetical protein
MHLAGLEKNYCGTLEFQWSTDEALQTKIPAGCSKRPFSKAAADESTGGVTFSPARPELLTQFYPDGLR